LIVSYVPLTKSFFRSLRIGGWPLKSSLISTSSRILLHEKGRSGSAPLIEANRVWCDIAGDDINPMA
jgi:hypothetical protein